MKTKRDEAIIKYYVNDKLAGHKIAELLELNSKTVYKVLKKHSVTRTLVEASMKYTCNDNFFNVINTEEKAYWLGVLFADGNISKKASKSGQVFFTSKDEEWVRAFMSSIGSNNKPRSERHNKFKSIVWKAQITSKQMFDDLNKLGCTPTKSKTIKFPKINEELTFHFIRGYFDGDGTVGVYQNIKTNSWKILKSGICSASEDFLKELTKKLPIANKSITKRANIYQLQLSLKDTIRLYSYMYNNSTIYLERKKAVFDKYLRGYTPRKRFNDYNRPS